MSYQEIILIAVISVIVFNFFGSFKVLTDSPEYSNPQKMLKLLLIWVLPILGVYLVLLFRSSDRDRAYSIEQLRVKEKFRDGNETGYFGA